MKSLNNSLLNRSKRKLFALMAGLGLPLIIDLVLYMGDQFFGVEKGVMFTYRLTDLILISNSLCILLALLYYFYPYLLSLQSQLPGRIKSLFFTLVFISAANAMLYFIYLITDSIHILGLQWDNFFLLTNGLLIGVALIISLPKAFSDYLRKIVVRSRPGISNFLISITSIIFMVILIEVVFYILLLQKNSDVTIYELSEPTFYRNDELLGLEGVPNVKTQHIKYLIDASNNDSTEVFSAQVTLDSNGLRTVDIPHMNEREKYALFMGCSFTFGIGVNDDETIAARFARKDTTYCPYNFGFGGWGPQNTLARFQLKDIENVVTQDSGFCVYTYIDDHIARAIGDMKTYTKFAEQFPYYDYKDDSVQYMGSFIKDRPVTSTFYSIMSESNFIKYFNINFPLIKTERHYKLTCDLIDGLFQEYKRHFRNDNFYVLLYPGQNDILPYLKEYDIKIITFDDLFKNGHYDDYTIEHDGHPNALAIDMLTDRLVDTVDSLQRFNKILEKK